MSVQNLNSSSSAGRAKSFASSKLIRAIKTRKKELFWTWIAYQTVKGLLTTSLIWIPLFMWWSNNG